jgi:hypothetical protein
MDQIAGFRTTLPPAAQLGTGRSIPRCHFPSSKWAAPAAHKHWAAPETYSGIETAHLGPSHSRLYSGASRAGVALARRPPLLPNLPPRLPAPTREQFFSGGYGRGGHSPAAPAGAGSIPAPFWDHPTSDGTHAQTRPLCPGRVSPVFIQQLCRTKLETLHKHSDTRLKITDHHPRTHKTSKRN